MGKFKYSDDELDMNKVLKMNQDRSMALFEDADLADSRKEADSNIASTIALLKSLGKCKQVQELADEISQKRPDYKLNHRPELEEWDSLLEQANDYVSNPVILEDIMTESEIQLAFQKVDEINAEFSRRTSIVNKTDLSFLAIATALQVAKSLIFPYVAAGFP